MLRPAAVLALLLIALPVSAQPDAKYVKKATRADTVRATLTAFDLPTLAGAWHYAGPFDNADGAGFDTAYPPEKGVDLAATYTGKNGAKVGWKPLPNFELGKVYDLGRLFGGNRNDGCVYLFTEIETKQAVVLPLFLGSDDTLSVFLNKSRVLHENHTRPAGPDQDRVDLRMSAGNKHQLLVKVCQGGGEWAVYVQPGLPDTLPPQVTKQFARDFPTQTTAAGPSAVGAEEKFYPVTTLPLPADCVLEAGGLAFRPDGKLLACTRRGEVWLVHNPLAPPADVKMTRFATGLHEPLGMWVQDDNTVFVVQRPELTKITDRNGDGVADEFVTVCDKWGVSGDYHEFAFGPARDTDGKFFITLNVGFGGGHQAKAPWRGWCVKVDPKTGGMEPFAYGLRSPNGVTVSPAGDLFYCDNQGEWVATNKMHHLKPGKFYGHQAGLKWVKDSPFAGKVADKVASGMRYDGADKDGKPGKLPEVDPPCIWFPYGRMGQSVSEPVWDTTGGRFGPFAGQCFVGDQTRSTVMRVALEKVNGVYQGAAFPFRAGLQCGVNRLAFAPDGSLFVGQTNRGWGSVGGKPFGLQRIAHATGAVPLEIHTMTVTPDGFELAFTKPIDPAGAKPGAFVMKSFTYVYASQYGYPETDTEPTKVLTATASADGKRVRLTVPDRRPGRVYELRLVGLKGANGEEVLHPEAYYTLNEVPK